MVLQQAGYNVPRFAVIPVSFFEKLNTIDNTSVEPLLPELLQYFDDGTQLAVRSSGVAEDGNNYSFAGQFKTILNVNRDNLVVAIVEVWKSAQDIAGAYLQHAGEKDVKMAVVVQEMIHATASGVAFGINPLTGNKDEVVINAVSGLGEGLVSGQVNADKYIITNTGIEQQTILDAPVLTYKQLQVVKDTVNKLATTFDGPQDIEFAFDGDEFYLLQSRPVTAVSNEKEKIVWDNSNIIESYPGLTLPLTFSFIEKMYAAVYRQLSVVLGVQQAKVEKYPQVYENMLGLLNGRVYYNLNSWYAALSLLPGYKLNAGFMEQMMGVKEKANVVLVTEEEAEGKKISGYLEVLSAAKSLLYNLGTVRKQKKTFVRDFDDVYEKYAGKDYSKQSIKDIYTDYLDFERMMVTKWKAPLVNDFFAMIYFGVLKKMCAKHLPYNPDIHNQLLASSKDIITTQPMVRLPLLAQILAQNTVLNKAFMIQPADEIWALLNNGQFDKELKEVQKYIDDWGERCVAELKLETITYTQEPEKLIAVLQTYITRGTENVLVNADTDAMRITAEEEMKKAFKGSWASKRMFMHVLKQARYLVSNRENLRYYRTKGFGVVRRMMLSIGKKMEEEQLLTKARDIFYLSLDEIEQAVEQKLDAGRLNDIVCSKKEDYKLFGRMPLPERVTTYGKQDKIIQSSATADDTEQLKELQGVACCPGIVHAKVCKVTSADSRFPNDEVLVTYATDPGYVVMFPSAKGILTERGSLLSHAAIVSREMNIPCIVGVDGLMTQLNDGDEIIMDGSTGVVKILDKRGR